MYNLFFVVSETVVDNLAIISVRCQVTSVAGMRGDVSY